MEDTRTAPESWGDAPRASRAPAGPMGRAPFTWLMVAANVVVFAAQVWAAQTPWAIAVMPDAVVRAFGGNDVWATLGDGRYETLLTSCFVHFSALHLGLNMAVLLALGPDLESQVSAGRFAPMYVVSGVAASAASLLVWSADGAPRVSAGASGAICGVAGAALVVAARTEGWRAPWTLSVARWLLFVFLLGTLPQIVARVTGKTMFAIDNAAHGGGAAAGAFVAALWRKHRTYGPLAQRAWVAVSALACIAAAGVFALREARDPYARLDAAARYGLVVDLIGERRCYSAQKAFAAATRVTPPPQRDDYRDVRALLTLRCGR